MNETQRLPLLRNPIPPLPENAPKGCIFSCEWGKDRRDIPDGNLHRKVESFINMATEIGGRDGKGGMVHGVRSLGSATLDLAYCAMGSFDIWWEGVSVPSTFTMRSLTNRFTFVGLLGVGCLRRHLSARRGRWLDHNGKPARRPPNRCYRASEAGRTPVPCCTACGRQGRRKWQSRTGEDGS